MEVKRVGEDKNWILSLAAHNSSDGGVLIYSQSGNWSLVVVKNASHHRNSRRL
jgi:hypothetical protein